MVGKAKENPTGDKPIETDVEPPVDDAPKLPEIDQESMEGAAERRADVEEFPPNSVVYLGVLSERRISREDWEGAGIENQGGVVWKRDEGHSLPAQGFTKAALQKMREMGEFRITESNSDAVATDSTES